MCRRSSILDKVLDNVFICPFTGCWLWAGGHSGDGRGGGYGRINIDGGTMAVHRVMYIVEHGPIPPKKQIDHCCPYGPDRRCCNPDHLEMVTHLQNQKRRDQRNRKKKKRKQQVAEVLRIAS